MIILRRIGSLAFVIELFTAVFIGLPWYVMVADDPAAPWWLKAEVFCLLGGILVVLATLTIEQKGRKTIIDPAMSSQEEPSLLLLNSDALPGKEIEKILGLVQGHTVFAIWLGKDLSAIMRLILGGELTEYTEMMGSARRTATSRPAGSFR